MSDKPVAWLYIDPNNPHLNVHNDEVDVSQFPHDEWFPVYTHPQPRKQLTDKEIDAYLESEWIGYDSYHDCFKEIVRWAEAAHGIKEKNNG